jgi:hypothetical protein
MLLAEITESFKTLDNAGFVVSQDDCDKAKLTPWQIVE